MHKHSKQKGGNCIIPELIAPSLPTYSIIDKRERPKIGNVIIHSTIDGINYYTYNNANQNYINLFQYIDRIHDFASSAGTTGRGKAVSQISSNSTISIRDLFKKTSCGINEIKRELRDGGDETININVSSIEKLKELIDTDYNLNIQIGQQIIPFSNIDRPISLNVSDNTPIQPLSAYNKFNTNSFSICPCDKENNGEFYKSLNTKIKGSSYVLDCASAFSKKCMQNASGYPEKDTSISIFSDMIDSSSANGALNVVNENNAVVIIPFFSFYKNGDTNPLGTLYIRLNKINTDKIKVSFYYSKILLEADTLKDTFTDALSFIQDYSTPGVENIIRTIYTKLLGSNEISHLLTLLGDLSLQQTITNNKFYTNMETILNGLISIDDFLVDAKTCINLTDSNLKLKLLTLMMTTYKTKGDQIRMMDSRILSDFHTGVGTSLLYTCDTFLKKIATYDKNINFILSSSNKLYLNTTLTIEEEIQKKKDYIKNIKLIYASLTQPNIIIDTFVIKTKFYEVYRNYEEIIKKQTKDRRGDDKRPASLLNNTYDTYSYLQVLFFLIYIYMQNAYNNYLNREKVELIDELNLIDLTIDRITSAIVSNNIDIINPIYNRVYQIENTLKKEYNNIKNIWDLTKDIDYNNKNINTLIKLIFSKENLQNDEFNKLFKFNNLTNLTSHSTLITKIINKIRKSNPFLGKTKNIDAVYENTQYMQSIINNLNPLFPDIINNSNLNVGNIKAYNIILEQFLIDYKILEVQNKLFGGARMDEFKNKGVRKREITRQKRRNNYLKNISNKRHNLLSARRKLYNNSNDTNNMNTNNINNINTNIDNYDNDIIYLDGFLNFIFNNNFDNPTIQSEITKYLQPTLILISNTYNPNEFYSYDNLSEYMDLSSVDSYNDFILRFRKYAKSSKTYKEILTIIKSQLDIRNIILQQQFQNFSIFIINLQEEIQSYIEKNAKATITPLELLHYYLLFKDISFIYGNEYNIDTTNPYIDFYTNYKSYYDYVISKWFDKNDDYFNDTIKPQYYEFFDNFIKATDGDIMDRPVVKRKRQNNIELPSQIKGFNQTQSDGAAIRSAKITKLNNKTPYRHFSNQIGRGYKNTKKNKKIIKNTKINKKKLKKNIKNTKKNKRL